MKKIFFIILFVTVQCGTQQSLTAPIYQLTKTGTGQKVGSITVSQAGKEIAIKIVASNLPPGYHGFHLHETNTLTPSEKDGKIVVGGNAGGHWDPDNTGFHGGPDGNGHRGDLPQLEVNPDGSVSQTIKNKKITLNDIKGRSLMIHAHPDNFSDHPEPLGGSGARLYAAPF
ncbi:superoxide dismutase, Cu-Zn family [Brevinema andersonii]|uniref:Superoxide dismutase, Cu-Zn family n=1 Tax=Brevinema andersonii TaxID=34097 RepID=A0A1I1DP15_BREAD|nr:superoxide dismutase family protein [Brevinema andersonii]SFB74798.1 superoxide dismutase, Cu-Zn family [Brevinema andersonii]